MSKKLKIDIDPQLIFVEHKAESAMVLSNKAKLSLYKKSVNTGIPANILEEVYYRGFSTWIPDFKESQEQFAFSRVNSFISGGFARKLDHDLCESKEEPNSEVISNNKNNPNSRFIGTNSLNNVFRNETPGQRPVKESRLNIIKRVVKEHNNGY